MVEIWNALEKLCFQVRFWLKLQIIPKMEFGEIIQIFFAHDEIPTFNVLSVSLKIQKCLLGKNSNITFN